MLAIHTAAVDSKIAVFHEFLVRYSKRGRVVYGFVEGREDPSFYRGFVELLIPETWEFEVWPAGSKDNVYKIHQEIDWARFPKARVCFFVDRDLSELISQTLVADTNIYVTDGYSIENAVVNRRTCHRVLTEVYGFAVLPHSDLEDVLAQFEREFDRFLECMIPSMAWILIWRGAKSRANLNNIKMGELFSIVDANLVPTEIAKCEEKLAHYLHSTCGVAYDSDADVGVAREQLRSQSAYRRFVRGKYVIWFLIEFCSSVHKSAAKLIQGLTQPPKIHLTISSANALPIVAGRARIPESLRAFVNATFVAHIRAVDVSP